ncbi:VUT family protein [Streptomyces hoynatensis]|uniref:VUT family protein n=1 Tax=Streptomyces hoynatensis TaxID=1141874 RepID=A0A3A9YY12_9ACTN|nr:VUT family protein [Streptomyces hoynatensis]RKN40770.1 VUT family protein [Streptomyces hoynatensis]
MTPARLALASTTLAAYIVTIPAANWLVTEFGAQPVGFGQTAPAGVYMAGLALVLRDLAREAAGRAAVLAAIAAGTLLSYLLADEQLATASAIAFATAELLDFAVYEPLRRRGLATALAASNAAGAGADSLLFLWLAFGSLSFLPGQLLGKAWMTALALAVLAGIRAARRSRAGVTA